MNGTFDLGSMLAWTGFLVAAIFTVVIVATGAPVFN